MGPLLLPMLGCIMVVLLVLGFGLVYLPHMRTSFAVSGGERSIVQDAFYFSGITLLTIGYGDITPKTEGLRLLSLVESASGIAVLSLATAYLLTVYSAVDRSAPKP